MGLDNGIRVLHKEGKTLHIPKKYYDYIVDDFNHYEIAYWRKCWGVRKAVLEAIIPEDYLYGYDSYDIFLDRKDIKKLISLMKRFSTKYWWNRCADSIWEYDTNIRKRQKRIVRNLKFIYWYMLFDPNIEAYFYDSY